LFQGSSFESISRGGDIDEPIENLFYEKEKKQGERASMLQISFHMEKRVG
jgi:hypothetical protein